MDELTERYRTRLIASAEESMARYPHYAGHWEETYEVATIRRRVTTKMGLAFERGDVVLIRRRPEADGPGRPGTHFVAWSRRNVVDTWIDARDFEWGLVDRVSIIDKHLIGDVERDVLARRIA